MNIPPGLTSEQAITAAREGGVVNKAYWDDKGKCWTVGIGCTGKDVAENTTWTDGEATVKFVARWNAARVAAQLDVGVAWSNLNGPRQFAMTDMCFQMGGAGVARFSGLISALRVGNWQLAHDECIRSKYDAETPSRCEANARTLLTGEYP